MAQFSGYSFLILIAVSLPLDSSQLKAPSEFRVEKQSWSDDQNFVEAVLKWKTQSCLRCYFQLTASLGTAVILETRTKSNKGEFLMRPLIPSESYYLELRLVSRGRRRLMMSPPAVLVLRAMERIATISWNSATKEHTDFPFVLLERKSVPPRFSSFFIPFLGGIGLLATISTIAVVYSCYLRRARNKALRSFPPSIPSYIPNMLARQLRWSSLEVVNSPILDKLSVEPVQPLDWTPIRQTTGMEASHSLFCPESTFYTEDEVGNSFGHPDSASTPAIHVPPIHTPAGPLALDGIVIQARNLIGSGNFSLVYRVSCTKPGLPPTLALKVLKKRLNKRQSFEGMIEGQLDPALIPPTAESMELFCREVDTLRRLGSTPHPNVVSYFGCSLDKCWVFLEYCSDGNLREYLRKIKLELEDINRTRRLSPDEVGELFNLFHSYARQIALGMDHLMHQGIVHRDLAARNILVCGYGRQVKISDFGLAIRKELAWAAPKSQVPVKWMSPEALAEQRYTEKSDVWSYSIVLWEITSLGGEPYAGTTTPERLLQLFQENFRLKKPTLCSENLWDVMQDGWAEIAEARPTFGQVWRRLEKQMEEDGAYLSLETINNVSAVYYKNVMDVRSE